MSGLEFLEPDAEARELIGQQFGHGFFDVFKCRHCHQRRMAQRESVRKVGNVIPYNKLCASLRAYPRIYPRKHSEFGRTKANGLVSNLRGSSRQKLMEH